MLVFLINLIFRLRKKTKDTLDYLLKRLNHGDNVWTVDNTKDEFIFLREENKVKESFNISKRNLEIGSFENLNRFSEQIQEFFLSPSELCFKEEEVQVKTPRDLMRFGIDQSKKGINVQRYKGLGEMNPDQLWDTTLDPSYRSILKVKVDDAQRADEIFSELMGEDVDKRKTFIQSNAKKVSNLDV